MARMPLQVCGDQLNLSEAFESISKAGAFLCQKHAAREALMAARKRASQPSTLELDEEDGTAPPTPGSSGFSATTSDV